MRIISRKALREFWGRHTDARQVVQSWYSDVKRSDWSSPSDIKRMYRSASIIANNRVVFNIKGNQYRIVVVVQYEFKIVYIRFIGTHSEYDRIDAEII